MFYLSSVNSQPMMLVKRQKKKKIIVCLIINLIVCLIILSSMSYLILRGCLGVKFFHSFGRIL
jgi:accessory gene regulator protein AgrB